MRISCYLSRYLVYIKQKLETPRFLPGTKKSLSLSEPSASQYLESVSIYLSINWILKLIGEDKQLSHSILKVSL